jgi:hypothetical protein
MSGTNNQQSKPPLAKCRKGDLAFSMLKNIIIAENKELFRKISEKYKIDYNELAEKYLKPEYYLPLVTK